MRDARAQYGILLLARVEKSGWRIAGSRFDLWSLVDHLQSLARETVRAEALGGVRVLAIDFKTPSASE